MQPTSIFEIVAMPVGRATVLVDGVDVSETVDAFQINAQYGDVTRVMLRQIPQAVRISGQGVIYIQPTGADVRQLLDEISPKEIERAALAAMQWSEKSLAEVMLEKIKEFIDGARSQPDSGVPGGGDDGPGADLPGLAGNDG